jgi:hypothetical protein
MKLKYPFHIKNWERFQHFNNRRPPWIKLYRDLLDDIEWHQLNAVASKVLVMLWLMASETDGYLPDIKTISFRLRMSEQEISEAILQLNHWVEAVDIGAISSRHQDDPLEREVETETETELEKEGEGRTYAYKGGFVKNVTEKSMQELQAICPHMTRADILHELSRCDQYYTEQGITTKSWWFKTTSWFARINTKKTERYSTKTDPAYRGVL